MAVRLVASAALAVIVTISGMPDAVAASHPSAPRSVAAKPGNTTVRITWVPPLSNGGAPIDHYGVQRAATSSGPWTTVAKPSPSTFAWKNVGLVNGTRYYYRVRAHNVVGWGTPSSVVSAVPRTVPSAPQSPGVTWANTSATVSWSVPATDGGAPINQYRLQYSTDDATWTNLSAGTQLQLTAYGLTNGTLYHFRERAHNVAGWGPPSVEVLATPGVPQAPVGISATSHSDGAAVTWDTDWYTGDPRSTTYDVQVSSDEANWSALASVPNQFDPPAAGASFTSGTLGQTYYFRVRGVNANGNGPWSSTVSTVFGLAPGKVVNPTITNYPTFNWNALSWSAPTSGSPVQGYRIDRIITEGTYQYLTTVAPADFPSYVDQGVTHFTYYSYRITPYNQLGDGPSVEVHVTTS